MSWDLVGDPREVATLTVDHELFEDRLPTYLTRFVGRRAEIDEVETY